MSRITILLLLLLPVTIMGCEETDTYPVSGEECHENDPVKDLDPLDCLPG